MNTWVALLRGINVGGRNILPMKKLVVTLESVGCSHVRTYIQSGNVIFRNAEDEASEIARLIRGAILNDYGFEPWVHLLSPRELENVAGSNPFQEAEADPKSLHVLFFSEEPRSPNLDAIKKLAAKNERYSLTPSAFYLHAPDGIGRSRLAAKVERLLGVETTGRNWRTVSKLRELLGETA